MLWSQCDICLEVRTKEWSSIPFWTLELSIFLRTKSTLLLCSSCLSQVKKVEWALPSWHINGLIYWLLTKGPIIFQWTLLMPWLMQFVISRVSRKGELIHTHEPSYLPIKLKSSFIVFKIGGLLVVSHDQYFVSKTCNELWVVEEGKASRFEGTFDDYKLHTAKKTQKRVEESVKKLSR